MTVELIVQIASLGALAVAIWGLVQNNRVHKRQSNAQIFLEYTGRYERIMSDYPDGAFEARLDAGEALPDPSEALSMVVLRYLNLCSEEFYLWRRGFLSADIWGIWEAELRRMIRSPLVRREWIQLRSEFESYPEFVRYVDDAQKGHEEGEARG